MEGQKETPGEYQLLDVAGGRRLERWSGVLVDRMIGAPDGANDKSSGRWPEADLVYEFEHKQGGWRMNKRPPEGWSFSAAGVTIELRPNDFGHLGVFPEHAQTWPWIASQVRPGMSVLNLFAHTGGATLAAALGGAEVAHVDSSSSMLGWGRRNAELSGLADAPIRWLKEGVMKFTGRELRRKRRYDAIVLDPPTFGRGLAREIWRIDESLASLLDACRELLSPDPAFVLLTCHTPGYGPEKLRRIVGEILPGASDECRAARLAIVSESGTRLSCGAAAYWSCTGAAIG